MITIVGGVYGERCMRPEWDDIFGSAGRAATAISRFNGHAELHAFVDNNTHDVTKVRAAVEGFTFVPTNSQTNVSFEYFHGLANPDIRCDTYTWSKLHVTAEKVLRFGMIEGTAVVDAEYAVFDPQSEKCPESFSANGSYAKHLALVLNNREAHSLLQITSEGLPAEEIAKALALQENAEVVIIKMGPLGALIFDNGNISRIPAYRTEHVWKIGSGDTFTAHFALGWLDNGLSAHEAASIASVATAFYCEKQGLPDTTLLTQFKPKALRPSARYCNGYSPKVYLAGPFFTLAELWMIGQARRNLKDMGLNVLSPYHDVGLGTAKDVAKKDLKGVHGCDVLFAIGDGLDPGTIYEIGYARALKKPVVFYSENVSVQNKKMIDGSGCHIVDDYVSAIYHVVWEAIEL